MVYPASIDDDTTLRAMELAWKKYGILLDPHGAVAFAAANQLSESPDFKGHLHTVILATGHPAKEATLVRTATGQIIPFPEKLSVLRKRADPIALIEPQLDVLEGAIAGCF
jgi:threonine synthase